MKYLIAAAAAAFAALSAANATPMTIGNVNFDSANAATEVLWAQGGVTTGLIQNRREACGPGGPDVNGNGPNGIRCRASEAQGFNLADSVEIDNNGTAPDDILSALFANPIANGAGACTASPNNGATGPANAAAYAGCDLLIFEVLNQPDNPTVALSIANTNNDTEILGVLLFFGAFDRNNDGDTSDPGDSVAIWGFDIAGLGVAVGQATANPLYFGRRVGTPDIAAIVGLNFAQPPAEIPLPAAAPLFFAGLAGLGLIRRGKKKAA